MSSAAKRFISGRKDPLALTRRRIRAILDYFVFCHELQVSEKRRYSRKWVKENTADKFENYLKKRLVHDYLKKRKLEYATFSSVEDILFECEPEMPYIQFDPDRGREREANDKIDIKINRLGLQETWKGVEDQDIYLAVECKVLNILSDNLAYQGDIQKFCDRNYLQFRLPFEAMIAFGASKKLEIKAFTGDMNKRLENCETIRTVQPLKPESPFNNGGQFFSSKHLRNYGHQIEFRVDHLYMDYTAIITE